MTTHFLPVTRLVTEGWNENMHWHIPPKYFFYPYMLVTPFVTGMKKHRSNFGESSDKLHIYADSGGYQIATQNKEVSVLDILRWQESIADIAFTVDVPLYSYEGGEPRYKAYTVDFFDRCMDASVKYANRMKETQANDKMKLWAVLQGRNKQEIMKWHRAITKDHNYDGYCIAITASVNVNREPMSWLSQLETVHELNTDIHFLGRCEPILVLILSKLSEVTGHTYTYDTSSTIVGPRYGKYYDPYFHNLIWLSHDKEKRPKMPLLPCDCPVCSRHDLDTVASTDYLITLHNLYCRNRFNEYANRIAGDDELFRYALKHFITISNALNNREAEIMERINHLIYGECKRITSLSEFY